VLRKSRHDDGLKTSSRQVPVLLICACLIGYFGYHAIQGKHGLDARSRLIDRSSTLERDIRGLETVLATLEREVALLSEARPDADYVEELARDILGFARPDERILIERPARR
jgi:cell division protein FtsB